MTHRCGPHHRSYDIQALFPQYKTDGYTTPPLHSNNFISTKSSQPPKPDIMSPTTVLTVALVGSSTASTSASALAFAITCGLAQPSSHATTLPMPLLRARNPPVLSPVSDQDSDTGSGELTDVDGEDENENTQRHAHGHGGHSHGGHGSNGGTGEGNGHSSTNGGGAAAVAGGAGAKGAGGGCLRKALPAVMASSFEILGPRPA
ncbi:hypothetical protein B0T09DRAFT_402130 [Sordaria sp. MPI-SDFR-AT-0083]|nr:hypothetical protein B0T09DRAFT_402130 [Sordaria sp. MPI-SDFR-AT-0083]